MRSFAAYLRSCLLVFAGLSLLLAGPGCRPRTTPPGPRTISSSRPVNINANVPTPMSTARPRGWNGRISR